MSRRINTLLALLLPATLMLAQGGADYWKLNRGNLFNHLDLTLNAGSTGLGFDLAAPVGDHFKVRAGFDAMVHFEKDLRLGVQLGDGDGDSKSNFDRMATLLRDLTGQHVDDEVTMKGVPTYYNVKLLADWYPFHKKNWHVTAGFYWGAARVGKGYNSTEDMGTLVAVQIYNNLYEQFAGRDPEYWLDHEFIGIGNASWPDYDMACTLHDRFLSYGRMGVCIGEYAHDITDAEGNIVHAAGSPYLMEPDKDCMVKASVYANRLKPYLGFGYGTDMTRSKNGWGISFDAGVMFWGGTPRIVTHDGTNLSTEVTHIRGRVGDYVDMVKAFKVFPVLNLRITKALF